MYDNGRRVWVDEDTLSQQDREGGTLSQQEVGGVSGCEWAPRVLKY